MNAKQDSRVTGLVIGLLSLGAGTGVAAHTAAQQPTGTQCSDWAEAVAVDDFGRTLVAGSAADNRILEWEGGHAHFGDFAIQRLLANGETDASFGVEGNLRVDVGDFDSVSAVLLAPTGVIAAGASANRTGSQSGQKDLVVLHTDEHGELTPHFGRHGIATFDLGGSESVAGLARAWWRGVYVAGTIAHEGRPSEGFVARVSDRGELDRDFGNAGVVRFALEQRSVRFFGVRAVWGGIAIGGLATDDGRSTALMLRLDARGELDAEYGIDGVASHDLPYKAGTDGGAAFLASGAGVVSLDLTREDGTTQVALVRFDHRGALNPDAQGAITLLDVPGGTQDAAYAVAIRARSILVAGATSPDDSATSDGLLARLTARGALDASFAGGIQTAHLDLEYTSFLGLAASARGITVAGYNFGEESETLPPSDGLVMRYRHDGSLDESFGDAGVVLVDYRNGAAACGPRVDVGAEQAPASE